VKVWIILLKGFAYIWFTVATLLVLAGIVGTWINGGFSAVQDLLSPFNIANFVVTAITFAPGYGAFVWAEKLKEKEGGKPS